MTTTDLKRILKNIPENREVIITDGKNDFFIESWVGTKDENGKRKFYLKIKP